MITVYREICLSILSCLYPTRFIHEEAPYTTQHMRMPHKKAHARTHFIAAVGSQTSLTTIYPCVAKTSNQEHDLVMQFIAAVGSHTTVIGLGIIVV